MRWYSCWNCWKRGSNFLLELLRALDESLDLLAAIWVPESREAIKRDRKCVLIMWSESLNAAAPGADLTTGLSSYVNQ